MKCFDSSMPKSNHLFKIVTILTNFFHKRHLDFTYESIRAIDNPVDYGWYGDF
jgi:hypothetical protein